MAAWAETTAFRRDILSTPWVVSERDQEKARRKVANEAHEKKLLAELKRRKRKRMESKNDNDREERKIKADILRRETSETAKRGKSHEKKPKKGREETMEASDKVVKPVVQGKFDALGF